MRRGKARSIFLAACALAATTIGVWAPASGAGAGPDPREATHDEVVEYYESGRFAEATARIAKRARRSLRRQLERLGGSEKAAIVLDIDDTALSTYNCQKRHGEFGSTELAICVIEAGFGTSTGTYGGLPPIKPVLRLYKLADRKGVSIHFITGRPHLAGTARQASIDNLRAAGYTGQFELTTQDDVRFTDNTANGKSLIPYKSAARAQIEQEGKRILVNIGDQRSDLQGGHAKATFKLPNPMYYTP